MNCTEFKTAVERAAEIREPLTPDALAHVSTCSECRSVLAIDQQLDAVIAAWRHAEPPTKLVDAVLAELSNPLWQDDLQEINELSKIEDEELVTVGQSIESTPRRRNRSRVLVIASLSVCLLIAVVSIGLYSGARSPHLGDLAQATHLGDSDPSLADSSMDVSETLVELLFDLQSEYREMATETTSAAREMVNAIPQRVSASMMPDPDEIDLLPSSSDVRRMWKPIGNRVGTAFSFLWQTVPSEVPSG